MKKNFLSYLYFIISVVVATFLWENISISKISYNPFNDVLRFIIFLFIPFSTMILFYQTKEKKFFLNFKKIIFFNNYSKIENFKNFKLNIYFFWILIFLFIEFLSLNFLDLSYKIDFFHEGMWLSASQNTKFSGNFWTSSYIVRGFFGDFYPFFVWKISNIESIGITRFFSILFVFFNKILLLLIAKKLCTISNLRKDFQIIYFLFLSIVFISYQGYGAPIFTPRSFLLLLFIYVFLNFLSNYRLNNFYVPIIGFFSSVSFFWYIDIGLYINFFIFILLLFFLIKLEFRNFLSLFFSIILGWLIFYSLISNHEFLEFVNNTFLILTTLNYIHGLVFPTPFISMDFRTIKSLLLFLFSGLMIIKSVNYNEEKKYFIFLASVIFLFFISCIYFNYGLSRSDGPHIRIATGYIFITFFVLGSFYFLKQLESKYTKESKNLKYINYTLILFVLTAVFIDKKYEDKKVVNLKNSFQTINQLIYFQDSQYISKEYKSLIIRYGDLTKDDKCVTIFTNEVAMYYFLKKPSCSKYYYMWTAKPQLIQRKIVEDINEKKPTYILYKSDSDLFYNSDKNLIFVNQYIKNNFSFFEKFLNWEIYKIN